MLTSPISRTSISGRVVGRACLEFFSSFHFAKPKVVKFTLFSPFQIEEAHLVSAV
jgi:hypothetical protein